MASHPPVLHRLVGFGRYLRAASLPVGTGRVLAFCRAAAALDPFDREDLRLAIPSRHSRRYRASPSGERLDFRRTIRQSLRTEGEPFRRRWKARSTRPRPLVLILDVSGSMAPYSRPLVEFAHAAVRAGRKVEVFCFGTRLTRITRAVRSRHP